MIAYTVYNRPYLVFFKFYLFLEKGREKEREKNISVWLPLVDPQLGTWPSTQACALTGNQTVNPLVHRPALNPLSHTCQGPYLFLSLLSHPDHVPCGFDKQ